MNAPSGDQFDQALRRIEEERAEFERLAPLAVDLSDEAIAQREIVRGPSEAELTAARAIRRRRRRLGQNGFSTRRMAVPR